MADFQAGDIVELHGVFRDGTTDERLNDVIENRQIWRVLVVGRGEVAIDPVLRSGEPDIASHWFGRRNAIDLWRGGFVSKKPLDKRAE